jgi:hypothetical protein
MLWLLRWRCSLLLLTNVRCWWRLLRQQMLLLRLLLRWRSSVLLRLWRLQRLLLLRRLLLRQLRQQMLLLRLLLRWRWLLLRRLLLRRI